MKRERREPRGGVPQGTVVAPVAASIVQEAASRGLAPGPLLGRLGLDASSARDPERRVPFGALFSVWADCMRALRDPGLPLAAAQRIRLEDYTVLGFAITSAPDFRTALSLLVRYGTMLADGAGWRIAHDAAHAGVRLCWSREGSRTLGHRVANECAVAEALHVTRQMLGTRLVPLAVGFRHPAPSSTVAHQEFFGVRPLFGATWDGIELPRDLVDRVPRQANPPLAAWLERQMASKLASRAIPATFTQRVELLLEQDVASGEPNLARVARALALSERTVRRHLDKEKLSFRGLWEGVRRRRAEALLVAGEITIDEVAFLTGYSETAAFARAFKRWTRETPGSFRKRAIQERGRIGQESVRDGQ
ncbi:MAG: AraC family transcriptional regulator [Pseudomonadota bacterium]